MLRGRFAGPRTLVWDMGQQVCQPGRHRSHGDCRHFGGQRCVVRWPVWTESGRVPGEAPASRGPARRSHFVRSGSVPSVSQWLRQAAGPAAVPPGPAPAGRWTGAAVGSSVCLGAPSAWHTGPVGGVLGPPARARGAEASTSGLGQWIGRRGSATKSPRPPLGRPWRGVVGRGGRAGWTCAAAGYGPATRVPAGAPVLGPAPRG